MAEVCVSDAVVYPKPNLICVGPENADKMMGRRQ